MKAIYRVTDKLNLEFDVKDQKELFEIMSTWQEVLGHDTCKACQSKDIRFVVRHVQKYTYYELRCLKCGSRLNFGCHQDSATLFPKLKDNEGNWLPNNGWTKYIPEKETN